MNTGGASSGAGLLRIPASDASWVRAVRGSSETIGNVSRPSPSSARSLLRRALRALGLASVLVVAVGCGGPGTVAVAPAIAGSVHHPERAEAHLFGLTEDAFPELAPLWPALSARPATEVAERMHIEGDEVDHCLRVVVAGDLAVEAREAWLAGARSVGYACAPADPAAPEVRCERDQEALVVWADGGPEDPDAARLEALATELGVPAEPSSTVKACERALPPARLASVDARLHRAGLLEPWRDLHERLGTRRLIEIGWTRAERGDEVRVRYRSDPEAFEQATSWARGAGLAGADGSWRRIDAPLSFALALREGPPAEIVLTVERAP